MTGPKNAVPSTAIIGVPTSLPTRAIPASWLAIIALSNLESLSALARFSSAPTSLSA